MDIKAGSGCNLPPSSATVNMLFLVLRWGHASISGAECPGAVIFGL